MSENFKDIIDKIPYAILIFNEGKILYSNDAFANLLGYEFAHEIVYIQSLKQNLKKYLDAEIGEYIDKQGNTIKLKQNWSKIQWHGMLADCIGFESSFGIEKIKSDVNQTITNEINLAQSRFLSAMSHEMRTPLNSILNLAALLRQTGLNKKQEELVDMAYSSAIQLLQRIEDVLEFAQVKNSEEIADLEAMHLLEITEPIINISKDAAKEKGLGFTFNYDDAAKSQFLGSPSNWQRVVNHLCDNAVKFTDKGNIEVNLRVCEDGIGIFIEVIDSGSGISQSSIESLFNAFRFDDNPANRSNGGLKLGLALSRKIARKFGGEITLEKNPKGGIIARGYFPFEIINQEELIEGGGEFSILNILVAEDNLTNQRVIKLVLDQIGHNVVTVDNGQKCVEATAISDYDLILMDLHMPIMDGYEATRQIRKSGNNIPIIALTADNRNEARKEAKVAGMNDFLTKPLMVESLYHALNNINIEKQKNAKAGNVAN